MKYGYKPEVRGATLDSDARGMPSHRPARRHGRMPQGFIAAVRDEETLPPGYKPVREKDLAKAFGGHWPGLRERVLTGKRSNKKSQPRLGTSNETKTASSDPGRPLDTDPGRPVGEPRKRATGRPRKGQHDDSLPNQDSLDTPRH